MPFNTMFSFSTTIYDHIDNQDTPALKTYLQTLIAEHITRCPPKDFDDLNELDIKLFRRIVSTEIEPKLKDKSRQKILEFCIKSHDQAIALGLRHGVDKKPAYVLDENNKHIPVQPSLDMYKNVAIFFAAIHYALYKSIKKYEAFQEPGSFDSFMHEFTNYAKTGSRPTTTKCYAACL